MALGVYLTCDLAMKIHGIELLLNYQYYTGWASVILGLCVILLTQPDGSFHSDQQGRLSPLKKHGWKLLWVICMSMLLVTIIWARTLVQVDITFHFLQALFLLISAASLEQQLHRGQPVENILD